MGDLLSLLPVILVLAVLLGFLILVVVGYIVNLKKNKKS